ncbi:hypothetical protein C0208_01555 [Moraxella catarrhalis]|uniref:hypothetical protein n=1 Tax=Moraxella catarrhalis TaxID=480 RepID=UPI00128BECDB|nr:hypothetical protein [Moraxella catarrhalis]MPW63511.1 hypothetical protein [Moraxella catarrhalis]
MNNHYYYAIAADKLSKKDYQRINNSFFLSVNKPDPTYFIFNLQTERAFLVNYSFSLDNDLTIKFFPNLKALIEGIYTYRLDKLIGI